MQNPYHTLVTYEGAYDNLFNVYLFAKIFQPIWDEYSDKGIANKLIRFILYGFSLESTMITAKGDRREELAAIFEHLEIDKLEYRNVILLENETIKKCVQRWLEFQDNAQLEYLLTLKESYIQHQSASLSNLKKASGEIDFDQKFRCIDYCKQLKVMIKDAEQELIQNNPKLKESYKIAGIDNTKRNSTRKGIENFLQENGDNQ